MLLRIVTLEGGYVETGMLFILTHPYANTISKEEAQSRNWR
jgi:hypothetical protein